MAEGTAGEADMVVEGGMAAEDILVVIAAAGTSIALG
jgi:hypothetical protein